MDLERRIVKAGRWPMTGWRCVPRGGDRRTPVVCVHGAGVSSRELRPLVAALGAHVPAWTVDLPGFGRSAKPPRPLDLAGLGDALISWLEAEDLPPACLVGCSFGCQLAVDVAVRHPERVHSLVLVGPTVDPQARSWPRMIGRWLRNSVRESPRMAPLNVADYWDAGMRRVVATFEVAMRDRPEDKLPRVAVPTLVVRGEYDRMVSQAWAEQVTRLIPRARLVIVPGMPHMIPFRDPQALAPIVTEPAASP
ncbi:pimeloyl-ACP methyl ester carboxylesterase [Nonomuraea polychroma]|uniref:Pimeloyl-ACP methyl ester carboxylesterase n=1 Tax=Nonomuraea polychroma TaxID=46176 RepID=A0A438M7G7_9ACTN|nr:alpha/beta hydrolase [Nonomuraea polychroma]RVX41673.1 pimeloyl-ACP methyl ester carboxylesterase [Nonomuraea polychroma]